MMHVNALASTHPLIIPLCAFLRVLDDTNHLLTNCLTADYGAAKFPFSIETLC